MTEKTTKLTKAQKEFFTAFARNDLGNALFPVLESQGLEFTVEKAEELLDLINLDDYIQTIGTAFLERTDFATLKRVDKILKSKDFIDVLVASHQVSDLINEDRLKILVAMLPEDIDGAEEAKGE